MKYSKDNIGAVGILIAAGNDLNGYTAEQLGTHLVNVFLKDGIKAECFISDHTAANGTALDFKVNGLSWGDSKALNLEQATSAETLKGVATEARLGNVLLTQNSNTSPALNPQPIVGNDKENASED